MGTNSGNSSKTTKKLDQDLNQNEENNLQEVSSQELSKGITQYQNLCLKTGGKPVLAKKNENRYWFSKLLVR